MPSPWRSHAKRAAKFLSSLSKKQQQPQPLRPGLRLALTFFVPQKTTCKGTPHHLPNKASICTDIINYCHPEPLYFYTIFPCNIDSWGLHDSPKHTQSPFQLTWSNQSAYYYLFFGGVVFFGRDHSF